MNSAYTLFSALPIILAVGCGITGNPGADDDNGSGAGSGAGNAAAGPGAGNGSGGAAGVGGSGNGAGSGNAAGGSGATGLDVLGGGTHSLDGVLMEEIGSGGDGLSTPTDVAFNPAGDLWVTNRGGDSMTVFAGSNSSVKYNPGSGQHFLANPSGLAFATNGRMATIHDENQATQSSTPADFMGPTLWPSSSSAFDGGHESHLDMLHNTPSGMGIAWEVNNVYWVFDGFHRSITRYDFHNDHGPGGTDHADGEISRFVEGEVAMVARVPSNLVFDHATNELYIADTGNNRVAILDTQSGTNGSNIGPNYDGADMYAVNNATITTFISGSEHGLSAPSGLAIHNDIVYVADNGNSTIYGFNRQGQLLDYLPTDLPPGCLMGLTVDPNGALIVVDSPNNRVLRISAAQ